MTDDSKALSVPEVSAWASGLAGELDRSLLGEHRDRVGARLRGHAGGTRAPLRALATLALLDDCLRVAHLAIEADGVSEADELERAWPLASVAARKYFQLLSGYEAFGEVELSRDELSSFLQSHRRDPGPFGGGHAGSWHGLDLCKEVARVRSHPTLVRDHERMLARVMDVVFAGRNTAVEAAARKRLRGMFEQAPADTGEDPRGVAFVRPDGPEVFSSIAFGPQVHEPDPLDVDSIHADARATFHRQLEHAITPIRHGAGHGRTMLMLGTSGSGKTHLLRAFRAHVHGERLGYVGYLQMTAEAGDYGRYVLQNLIASLERPYDTPALMESGLMYLSDGLAEHADAIPKEQLETLRSAELDAAGLGALIGGMVDRLMRTEGLTAVDTDLIQAVLLLQRRDAAIQRRVLKFLRCDPLTAHEQALLGGLAPRSNLEDPGRTIEQLGALMFHLHQAAIVFLVDQIEDAMPDAEGVARVQRAIDVLRRIADAVPSAVVVIACLEDVYDTIRPRLTQSVIDRLEREPQPVRLASERRREEIEAMLRQRLQHLYEALDAGWREDDPLYPFTPDDIERLANQRARDCLAFFHAFQQDCIRAGHVASRSSSQAIAPVKEPPAVRHDDLDRAWADARTRSVVTPDDDAPLLMLVARGLEACRHELDVEITSAFEHGRRPRLTVRVGASGARIVEVCNQQPQGGHLAAQLLGLCSDVPAGTVPVAVRIGEFSFKPKSVTAQKVGEFVASGGIPLPVTDDELRTLVTMEAFQNAHAARPDFSAWRRARQHVAQMAVSRRLLGDAVYSGSRTGGVGATTGTAAISTVASPRAPAPPAPVASAPAEPRVPTVPSAPGAGATKAPAPVARGSSPAIARPDAIRLGVGSTVRAEPVHLEIEQLKKHAAFLGGTGSGKTTIALNVIEQLLERGVSAILVDRKGDLARYASRAWWSEVPGEGDQAHRKAALREKVDVTLYTPGDASGRPLGLPVIPAGMDAMSTQERDQVAKVAAGGLAAMMGYGRSEKHTRRIAILKVAIELHGSGGGTTIEDLRSTIERPDPQLLSAVGNLGRHFSGLGEDLATLWINNRNLLGGAEEVLDVPTLLARRDGRPRLILISTAGLTDVSVIQFWVSRLLVELGRYVRANPSGELQTVAFFDEADAYIPATSSPPTKEPMFDLLRRARSGGLGILLATQNPGDIDYNARNNLDTWLVGRVKEDRAIEKMRNLLGNYPNVATRLAAQATGSFFLLGPQSAREIRADRSLMVTEQLGAGEIAALARDP